MLLGAMIGCALFVLVLSLPLIVPFLAIVCSVLGGLAK